jgi:hypothetical protein
MSAFHDYESYGVLDFNHQDAVLLEAYSGTAIVQWYGNIERQLGRLLEDAEKGRNWPYADKVREFLRIWRDNEITGSINREQIDILKSASDVLAVDSWNLKNYFSNLRDQLRKLIASEEELPRDLDMNANDPMRGGGGGGRGAPPLNPEFGPEGQPPGANGEPPMPQDGQPPNAGADQGPGQGQPGDPNQQGGGDGLGGGLEGGPPGPGDEDLPDNQRNQGI